MPWMNGGGADIAGIRAVMFEKIHARLSEEIGNLVEILQSPLASQARRVSKNGAAGFAGGGIDDIVGVVDATAAEQRVAPHLDSFAVSVVDVGLHLGEIHRVLVLHLESAAKGVDDHFKSHLRALIYRGAEQVRARAPDVHHDRVLSDPGSECAPNSSQCQSPALPFCGVVRNQIGSNAGVGFSRLQTCSWANHRTTE